MTTYDDIWEIFVTICGVNSLDAPKSDNEIYSLIKQATMKYNQLAKKFIGCMQNNLKADDEFEEFNLKLTDVEKLILTNLIAQIMATKKYTEFTSIWSVFAKETGIQNYQAQCKAKENTINIFKDEVDRLILDQIDSFNLGG